MDIQEINKTIAELENGSTSYNTCQRLASLYIVRDKLSPEHTDVIQNDKVEKEFHEILPMYHKYVDVKKHYQMREVSEDAVDRAIGDVCKEIEEFICTMYSGTDTEFERVQIRTMLRKVSDYAD